SGGNITITAGADIRLNGEQEFTSIRTRDNVTLSAANIMEAQKGRVIAGGLTVDTAGSALMTGPNELAVFNATSTGGEVTLSNTGALEVTGLTAGSASLSNNGAVTISGPWVTSGQTNITAFGFGASLTESAGGFIQANGFN